MWRNFEEASLSNVSYFPRIVDKADQNLKLFADDKDTDLSKGRATAGAGIEIKPLPASLALVNRAYQELDVQVDAELGALWCRLCPDGPPSFTPSMLRELNVLHHDIGSLFAAAPAEEQSPLNYYVQGSSIPGIYNMGGDFAFMKGCVARNDREALKRYAFDCVESVHRILTGFNSPVISIALIQGDALGGGFEGALCCNVIVAERSSRMGFPEILFNTFPGMGAYSILSRRLSPVAAERLIMSGKVHSAEEMYEMGLVDILCEDGEGEAKVREYMKAGASRHRVRKVMFDVRQRVNPVTLEELHDVTEMWTDHVLKLAPSDLRRMSHLQAAQVRRLSRLKTDPGGSAPPDA
jgi:DSF synthase